MLDKALGFPVATPEAEALAGLFSIGQLEIIIPFCREHSGTCLGLCVVGKRTEAHCVFHQTHAGESWVLFDHTSALPSYLSAFVQRFGVKVCLEWKW